MALQRRSRTNAAERAQERGTLAAVIIARRQELGLRQVELADLAGVSPRFVHSVETGRAEVGLDRLLAVLETLGLHLEVVRGARPDVGAGDDVAREYGLFGGGPEGSR